MDSVKRENPNQIEKLATGIELYYNGNPKSEAEEGTNMGRKLDGLKSSFATGVKLGENPDIPVKEAFEQAMEESRREYAATKDYAECRSLRKKAVAKRLHDLRTETQKKQQEVAEQTGLNVITLSGYEIAKNEPNMEALVRLADAYGVTLDYLMCRTDDEARKNYSEE